MFVIKLVCAINLLMLNLELSCLSQNLVNLGSFSVSSYANFFIYCAF